MPIAPLELALKASRHVAEPLAIVQSEHHPVRDLYHEHTASLQPNTEISENARFRHDMQVPAPEVVADIALIEPTAPERPVEYEQIIAVALAIEVLMVSTVIEIAESTETPVRSSLDTEMQFTDGDTTEDELDVINTHERIMQLLYAESQLAKDAQTETDDITTDALLAIPTETTEDMLSPSEEAVTLQQIVPEQLAASVQEIVLQLIEQLEVASRQEGTPEAVSELLYELEATLPKHATRNPREIPHISLEMTEHMLALLDLLGYHYPSEVLVGFIERYGADAFLQALEYICRQNNGRLSHELLVKPTAVVLVDDAAARLRRVGHLLLKVLVHHVAEPSLQPAYY